MTEDFKRNAYWTLVIGLCVLGVFSLGYFTANVLQFRKPPIIVEKINDSSYSSVPSAIVQEGAIVASVNSDKYHFERCSSAKRIKEENKIYFASVAEAELAGFVLAGNCK